MFSHFIPRAVCFLQVRQITFSTRIIFIARTSRRQWLCIVIIHTQHRESAIRSTAKLCDDDSVIHIQNPKSHKNSAVPNATRILYQKEHNGMIRPLCLSMHCNFLISIFSHFFVTSSSPPFFSIIKAYIYSNAENKKNLPQKIKHSHIHTHICHHCHHHDEHTHIMFIITLSSFIEKEKNNHAVMSVTVSYSQSGAAAAFILIPRTISKRASPARNHYSLKVEKAISHHPLL